MYADVGTWVDGAVNGAAHGKSGELGDLPEDRGKALRGRVVISKIGDGFLDCAASNQLPRYRKNGKNKEEKGGRVCAP